MCGQGGEDATFCKQITPSHSSNDYLRNGAPYMKGNQTTMTGVPQETGEWIRRFHPSDAQTRLVCFPHAGGAATFYHPVSQALSPSVDVLAVQYPGRQERHTEPCISDLSMLAERVAEELHPWTDRPMAFFGHSMGAILGYEVARRLQSSGVQLLTLFASGRRAPSCLRDEDMHRRDNDGIIDELKQLQGTDARLLDDPEIVRMLLPAIRSDYQAVETYRYEPGPLLTCPIIALTGNEDPHVTYDEATSWRSHTSGPFELQTYSGGHFYLNSHAAAVMETIVWHIRAASSGWLEEPRTA
ncbi:surfactin synthase thioesterase subunit [Streptomyces sp. 2333.5]|nr:surfactin synthase thioesterase subunit [Streptomyces sp. 2333.5]SEE65598.1 Surfactin synthase thioesterase subunit [Streptomyces sp. 2314.4]SEE92173.1 Surfactin synthase thioesterase subunit [Streptomyces sp. 2112.2]